MTDEQQDAKIELMRNGVWTDITGDVARVEIARGLTHPDAEPRPTTATVTLHNQGSLFAQDAAAPGAAQRLSVKVRVPASRWQALKARLKRRRGFGWLPVRMKWVTRFTGPVDSRRSSAP